MAALLVVFSTNTESNAVVEEAMQQEYGVAGQLMPPPVQRVPLMPPLAHNNEAVTIEEPLDSMNGLSDEDMVRRTALPSQQSIKPPFYQ